MKKLVRGAVVYVVIVPPKGADKEVAVVTLWAAE